MPTNTKTQRKRSVAEFTREAATWPTIKELAADYGVSERWVRECVQHGRIAAIRLDLLRVDPDDWEAFLRERYRPADTD